MYYFNMFNHMIIIIFSIFVLFVSKENYCRSCLVLNDNINEISLQQDASFSVPTHLYYWHLHVSSFKKRSIFGYSDRHIHLLIRILLSNQVELNPGPQSLDDSSYRCSICSQESTWDFDAIVCDNWCHIGCVSISPSM